MEEYGACWKYIPLSRIENISFKEGSQSQILLQDQEIFVLYISLTSKEKIPILFSQDNKHYMESFLEKYYPVPV
jgi:hypothetical protein